MSVVDAVNRDLERLGDGADLSALAATALALAAVIDSPGSPTSKAMVAKELRETLAALRALAPPKKEADRGDELAERRRAARVARGAAS
jgi:hypothetical protein